MVSRADLAKHHPRVPSLTLGWPNQRWLAIECKCKTLKRRAELLQRGVNRCRAFIRTAKTTMNYVRRSRLIAAGLRKHAPFVSRRNLNGLAKIRGIAVYGFAASSCEIFLSSNYSRGKVERKTVYPYDLSKLRFVLAPSNCSNSFFLTLNRGLI